MQAVLACRWSVLGRPPRSSSQAMWVTGDVAPTWPHTPHTGRGNRYTLTLLLGAFRGVLGLYGGWVLARRCGGCRIDVWILTKSDTVVRVDPSVSTSVCPQRVTRGTEGGQRQQPADVSSVQLYSCCTAAAAQLYTSCVVALDTGAAEDIS